MTRDPEHAGSQGDHTVVLYGDDRQYVRAVAEYASGILASGGSVVLLGASAQLRAAKVWIELACGTAEPPGVQDRPGVSDRYVSIDADALAEELALAREPAQVFEELLSRARVQAGTAATAVLIFGSLIGALWERGERDVAAAVELLGTRLADEPGTSVLCAYPASVMTSETGRAIVESNHSAIVPTPALRLLPLQAGAAGAEPDPDLAFIRIFPPEAPACRAARHFVRDILASTASNEEVIDAMELICSELSANAVRHARSAFTVAIEQAPTHVRIAVVDELPPAPDNADSFPVRAGRGLGIVAALARDWGVEHDETGHAVWAEVAGEDAGPRAPAHETAPEVLTPGRSDKPATGR